MTNDLHNCSTSVYCDTTRAGIIGLENKPEQREIYIIVLKEAARKCTEVDLSSVYQASQLRAFLEE